MLCMERVQYQYTGSVIPSIQTQIRIHTHSLKLIHQYSHIYTHTYIHTYSHTLPHTPSNTHIHSHTHPYSHIHTHTIIQTFNSCLQVVTLTDVYTHDYPHIITASSTTIQPKTYFLFKHFYIYNIEEAMKLIEGDCILVMSGIE